MSTATAEPETRQVAEPDPNKRRNTTVMLTLTERAMMHRLTDYHGFNSMSDTVRYLMRNEARRIRNTRWQAEKRDRKRKQDAT